MLGLPTSRGNLPRRMLPAGDALAHCITPAPDEGASPGRETRERGRELARSEETATPPRPRTVAIRTGGLALRRRCADRLSAGGAADFSSELLPGFGAAGQGRRSACSQPGGSPLRTNGDLHDYLACHLLNNKVTKSSSKIMGRPFAAQTAQGLRSLWLRVGRRAGRVQTEIVRGGEGERFLVYRDGVLWANLENVSQAHAANRVIALANQHPGHTWSLEPTPGTRPASGRLRLDDTRARVGPCAAFVQIGSRR
jgi:hypothetical protein